MAQENTAVNRLIESAGSKPVDPDGELEDLFMDPAVRAAKKAAAEAAENQRRMALLQEAAARRAAEQEAQRRAEAARAEAAAALAAAQAPPKRPTIPPPPFRPSQQIAAQGTPAPEILARKQSFDYAPDEGTPLPPPMPHPETGPAPRTSQLHGLTPAFPQTAITREEDSWFDPSNAPVNEDEGYVMTSGVVRSGGQAKWWIAGAFALALGIGALLFWPGDGDGVKSATTSAANVKAPAAAVTKAPEAAPAPAPTVAPLPAPAPAPTAAPAPAAAPAAVAVAAAVPAPAPATSQPPAAAPGEVVVRFESVPPGASVVLVQDGQMTSLGASPVEHSIDPSKHIEAMFALEGHASVVIPVDPSSRTISATLASSGAATTAVAAVAPAPVPAPAADTEPAPAPTPAPAKHEKAAKHEARAAAPAPEPKRHEAAPKKAASAASGEGILMIASKPPCQIFVDGHSTGLSTPQRDLALKPGPHKIMLVNSENSIKTTFSVTVKANESVRVIKDLTDQMK